MTYQRRNYIPNWLCCISQNKKKMLYFCRIKWKHINLKFQKFSNFHLKVKSHLLSLQEKKELQTTLNPSIYNIIRRVAWTMGQTNRRPSVWCSKYYFFSWFLAEFFAKILSIYLFIFLKKYKNKSKEFWVP